MLGDTANIYTVNTECVLSSSSQCHFVAQTNSYIYTKLVLNVHVEEKW